MRHGVLMRKVLYSGACNADVWLQLFPMSLADRSFDSDGNCVCVCVCVLLGLRERFGKHSAAIFS